MIMNSFKTLGYCCFLMLLFGGCVSPTGTMINLPAGWYLPKNGGSTLINENFIGEMTWDGKCLNFVQYGSGEVVHPRWPEEATFDGVMVTVPAIGEHKAANLKIGSLAKVLGIAGGKLTVVSDNECPGRLFDIVTMEKL